MLLHAATDRLRAAAPRLHRIGMSVGLQLKHVEVPGTVVDEETLINEIGAGAIVNLGPHSVGQAYLPAAKFREWQRQSALCLAAGIIDDDDMAGAVLTGPGRGDEAIRGPVVGPSWLRFYLRPGAVAKGRLLQYNQQSGIKGSDLRVCRLDRTAAQVGRHSDPSSLKLALMEEPQSRGQEGDDRRRLIEALIVTIGKTLLLQGPFEIPIHLSHKGEVRIFLVDRRGRLRPERLRRQSPSALEYVRQKQHRHVAAYAVALAGDRD